MASATLPVAICGMGMHLPGDIRTPDALFDFLSAGRDARGPPDIPRYNDKARISKRPTPPADLGYWLPHSALSGAGFDPALFSLRADDAVRADPRQRLLLQATWEALEAAGEREDRWRGGRVGCFVGSFGDDMRELLSLDPHHHVSSSTRLPDRADYALANRVSYALDLRGPSVTVKTACSASGVALHMACAAIRAGECESAVVAGANLVLSPGFTGLMAEQGVLAGDASCKTFDAAADGYARAEGVGCLFVKRLDLAIRHGNPVRAVVRGSAVNSDGKTPGLATPSAGAQEAVIREAYRAAGIPEDDVWRTAIVECHGTGTAVGDAVEANSIASVFGEKGVVIGSVKPNLGHTEAAAALMSVFKAVVSLERRIVLPNIKFGTPNPRIPFASARITVPTELMPWPEDRLERVGVSAFGIGGTNVHIILDSASMHCTAKPTTSSEPPKPTISRTIPPPATLLLFSACTDHALQARVDTHQTHLETSKSSLSDLSFTLCHRRTHLPHRTFSIIDDTGTTTTHPSTSFQSRYLTGGPTFIFTGQGAQYPRMALHLLKGSKDFLQDISAMDAALRTLLPAALRPKWTIRGELAKSDALSRLSDASIAQPASTALQVALVRHLARHGVRPGAVVGHSSGEIAAAYAAGVLSMEEAVVAAYLRGHCVVERGGKTGGMAAVGLGRLAVEEFLNDLVCVACENSSTSVTLSGDRNALELVVRSIRGKYGPGVSVGMLKVDTGYHSYQMRAIGPQYQSFLEPVINPKRPLVPFYSTVSGQQLETADDFCAEYWRRNLESPVLFNKAVARLLDDMSSSENLGSAAAAVHLEVGPHSILAGPLKQIYADTSTSPAYIPLIVRKGADSTNSAVSFLSAIGELHCRGVAVELPVPEHSKVLADLPPYPWVSSPSATPTPLALSESRAIQAWRFPKFPPHQLLGSRIPADSAAFPTWRCLVSLDAVPWLADHGVAGDVVFPAAGYVAMAGEVVRQVVDICEDGNGYTIRDMRIEKALVFDESRGNKASVELLTTARREMLTEVDESLWWEVSIHSVTVTDNNETWTKHCTCRVRSGSASQKAPTLFTKNTSLLRFPNTERWYKTLRRVGHDYGPRFRGMSEMRASVTSQTVSVMAAGFVEQGEPAYPLHPTTIDQALQSLIVAAHSGQPHLLDRLHLPVRFDEVFVADSASAKVYIKTGVKQNIHGQVQGDCIGTTLDKNTPVLWIKGIHLTQVALDGADTLSHDAVQLVWKPHIDLTTPNTWLPARAGTAAGLEFRDVHILLEELFDLCAADVLDTVPTLNTAVIPPHMARHLSWLRARNPRQAIFTPASSPIAPDDKQSRAVAMQRVLDRLRDTPAAPAATLIGRCRSNAAQFFTGETPPLDVFLQNNALHALYDWMNSLWSYRPILGLLSHLRGRRLRILEVGAGTGGLTARILGDLRAENDNELPLGRYTFTDVSSGFFPAARERFASVQDGVMEYRVLDVSSSPREQGFEEGGYDLVIASNVLHATPDLTQTLRHVRSLLAPDGRLLLQELTCETKWINFIFGFLPGWWLGVDDGREAEPYLVFPRDWTARLEAAGFARPDCFVHDAVEPLQLNASIVARPATHKEDITPRQITILSGNDDNELSAQLEDLLCKRGHVVQQCRYPPGSDGLPANIHQGDVISLIDLVDQKGIFHEISEEELESMKALVRALTVPTAKQPTLLWLTRSSQLGHSAVLGAARTIRAETGLCFASLEVEETDAASLEAACKVLDKTRSDLDAARPHTSPDMEFSHSPKTGVLVPRCRWTSFPRALHAAQPKKSGLIAHALQSTRPGSLDSLSWLPRALPEQPPQGHVRIKVHSAGINFKDVVTAIGLPGITPTTTPNLGCEASGIVTAVGTSVTSISVDDRVLVFAPHIGCLSTTIDVPEPLCTRIPDRLDLSDAAGMACVYTTALRALVDRANMQPGQTVLIHSAAGGLGIAAVQIARHIGAGRIFATAGTKDKADFLWQQWGIPPSDVFSSRDAGFLEGILTATDGRGVDVVLNSLSGELLHASWRCVAAGGTFVEVGKRDTLGRGWLAMDMFDDNRTFAGVEMARLAEQDPVSLARLLQRIVGLYEEGSITPVHPLRRYPTAEADKALRYLSQGRHVGKIVVEVGDDLIPETTPSPSLAPPTPTFHPDAAYLLVGGLGGLGLSIARWMTSHGARCIVFASRSAGNLTEDIASSLTELREMGCEITTIPCDVSDEAAVLSLVESIHKTTKRRIAGALHMAMVLADASFSDMTISQWRTAVDPKTLGAWNLHRALPSDLDFFVLFGSLSGLCGHPGQANYAAANTLVAGLCRHRRAAGLSCSVLDLGGVDDIGYVGRERGVADALEKSGARLVSEREMLAAVQLAMAGSRLDGGESDGHFAVGLGCALPLDHIANSVVWKRDARMAFNRHRDSHTSARDASTGSSSSGLAEFLSRARDGLETLDAPAAATFLGVEIARRVLGFVDGMGDGGGGEKRDPAAMLALSPASLGLDSLVTIEIRNWWRHTLGVEIGVLQLAGAQSFEQLGRVAAGQIKGRMGR